MMKLAIPADPARWTPLIREALALVLASGTGIAVWLRKRAAREWPTTHGKVEHASSYENDGTWLTDVSYSYSVAGEFYSGQFQLKALGEKRANDHVLRWKGQSIAVRYSPKNPEISVVRAEDQAGLHPEEFRGH